MAGTGQRRAERNLAQCVNGYNSSPGDGKLCIETAYGAAGLGGPKRRRSGREGPVATHRCRGRPQRGHSHVYRNGAAVATGSIRSDFTNSSVLYLGGMGGNNFPFRSNMYRASAYACALTSNELAVIVNAVNASDYLEASPTATIASTASTGAIPSALATWKLFRSTWRRARSRTRGLCRTRASCWAAGGTNRTVTVTPAANQAGKRRHHGDGERRRARCGRSFHGDPFPHQGGLAL